MWGNKCGSWFPETESLWRSNLVALKSFRKLTHPLVVSIPCVVMSKATLQQQTHRKCGETVVLFNRFKLWPERANFYENV